MNKTAHVDLSHEQARAYLLAAADGILGDSERANLQHHLRICDACRSEATRLNALHHNLKQSFHARWDAVPLPVEPLVTELPKAEPLLPRLARFAVNLILMILWFWLYRAVFGYLQVIFSSEEFRTNQIILAIILILVVIQYRQRHIQLRFDVLPQIHLLGLSIALGGSAAYLVVERFLDINTLSATLFGLATYGLFGLWMSPRRWQEGLPAALLLIGVLPFGDHLQTFVGYPMRIATATIVQNALGAVGIHSVGVDTILVLESGLAQVDLPCSGIKSLWTGMLFLVAATWIERRAINGRWLVIAGLLTGLLFVANVARVAALVLVGQVAGWSLVAETIHVPLGVLAFLAVCGAAMWLIRRQKPLSGPLSSSPRPKSVTNGMATTKRPAWLAPLLAVVIAGMALIYTPRPLTATAQAGPTWSFPDALHTRVSPLSPEIFAWATSGGADFADRWLFQWQSGGDTLNGSFLFLTSTTWRGQHRPERCFEVDGFTVEASQTVMLAADFPARMVLLQRGSAQVSALYWLQTADKVTDDFATRIWADLSPQRQRWVLVTVLLDDVYSPDLAAVQSLAQNLRSTVAASLKGEKP